MTVKVEGLNKTIRALRQSGADMQDMKDLMHEIGTLIVNAAQPPVKSGALAGSIRAGRGATKAVVRAGGVKAKYAGVQNYGWPARNIPGTRFLNEAAEAQKGNAISTLDQGIGEILRRNDLQ
ncbi:HK97 gp10 family phage protein [Frigoribacterium faeni]|uniref:Phage gpG-like protein n=1 Tax=Frigoribacterium faeni TaxID=145483 RepID=A0A7W3PHW7_9MICO|nr:HK97 gp10 family phage protein [Frigoribacterium faeni]MBA8812428.1 phage gpG-like protein [Frigoribacterium faeni]